MGNFLLSDYLVLIMASVLFMAFSGDSVVKNPHGKAGDVRDLGSIPGSGRPPREGSGNSL